MPIRCLPDNPDLEHLRNQARDLQRGVRGGDAEAVDAVREHHPRFEDAIGRRCSLADAQLVIARSYGFASWARLKRHVEVVRSHTRKPHLVEIRDDADGAERLLRLGCLVYGDDDIAHHAEARRLVEARPDLGRTNIWTAAATGDLEATAAFLATDASLAVQPGGPFGWEPLLYVAYSRIGTGDPVGVARLLLDRGADANAGYLWDGLTSPFTALTGALGGGEDDANQPPHPHSLELARMLLEAGADPNDSQALYNRHFGDDMTHLTLLFEFGLGTGDGGPWHRLLGHTHQTPQEMLDDQLVYAAAAGRIAWVRLLLAHGANPDGRGHPVYEGRTAYEVAVRRGNREVANLLLQAGATAPVLNPAERLLVAAMAGDAGVAEELMTYDPTIVDYARRARPHAVLEATEVGRVEAVRVLASLGFDVNARKRITALHQAAYDGNVELVRVLLELGADPTILSEPFASPPLSWAQHTRQEAVVAILEPLTPGPSAGVR